MTRKDYVAIAAALVQAGKYCETQNQRRGVERSAHCVADVMAQDNAKFNRALFLKSCGVQA